MEKLQRTVDDKKYSGRLQDGDENVHVVHYKINSHEGTEYCNLPALRPGHGG